MGRSADPLAVHPQNLRPGGPAGWFRRAAVWALWALALAPLTILLHEFGHLLAGLVLGVPEVQLHFSHVSHGDLGDTRPWVLGVVGFAGPAVTLGLIAFGMLYVRRQGPLQWPLALVATAASRLFVAVPHTIFTIIRWLRGQPLSSAGFDEYKAATAFGWPGNLPLVFTSVVFALAMVWLGRMLPRGQRSAAWTGLVAGTAAGWSLWMLALGPWTLP